MTDEARNDVFEKLKQADPRTKLGKLAQMANAAPSLTLADLDVLYASLTAPDREQRIQDLLEANNRYLQRARDAECHVRKLMTGLMHTIRALNLTKFIYMKYAPNDSWKAGWTQDLEAGERCLDACKSTDAEEERRTCTST